MPVGIVVFQPYVLEFKFTKPPPPPFSVPNDCSVACAQIQYIPCLLLQSFQTISKPHLNWKQFTSLCIYTTTTTMYGLEDYEDEVVPLTPNGKQKSAFRPPVPVNSKYGSWSSSMAMFSPPPPPERKPTPFTEATINRMTRTPMYHISDDIGQKTQIGRASCRERVWHSV